MTLGTCFWARTSALKELLEVQWKYEDFPDEPMAIDGTISHAIERIFPFVAEDAGYQSAWVMTQSYASKYMKFLMEYVYAGARILKEELELSDMESVYYWDEDVAQLTAFIKEHGRFFVYGTGQISKRIQHMLRKIDAVPIAYIVTKKTENQSDIEGVPILQADEAGLQPSDGVIAAVGYLNLTDVLESIRGFGVDDENIFLLTQYRNKVCDNKY